MHVEQGQRRERRVERQVSWRGLRHPALMQAIVEALELGPGDRVLQIGTGSGYETAVLAQLAREVFTVERQITLCKLARERLRELGYDNVHVRCCDGTDGWREEAPFDAIVIAAGNPAALLSLRTQLAIGGRLVMPVRDEGTQRLLRVRCTDDNTFDEDSV
jgi:protein-L-isoaspartate(D-aspartate) O-methyltransferase